MLRLLTSLFGPVCAKELVELSRRPRYYVNRVIYGSALLLILFLFWQSNEFDINMARPGAAARLAELGSAIFFSVAGVQYLAVYIFVPVFLCGVIASEREERTLELLMTTHLRDREIVVGKLLSRLTILLLLLASGLPVLNIVLFFGGVEPDGLFRTQASTVLGILFAAAHGIYYSTTSRSPGWALVRTYWWLSIWLIWAPFLVALVVSVAGAGDDDLLALVIVCFNPGFQFLWVLWENVVGWGSSLPLGLYLGAFPIPLIWSAVLIWRSVGRLRREQSIVERMATHAGEAMGVREPVQRLRNRLSELRRWRAPRICWLMPVRNPVYLRARLTAIYDRDRHIWKIQCGGILIAFLFLCYLVFFENDAFSDDEVACAFLLPLWFGSAILLAVVSASSLIGDRRRGFFPLVLTTDLRPREIIDGTWMAVWHHLRPIMWFGYGLGTLFVFSGALKAPGWLAAVVTVVLYGWTIVSLGVTCGLVARTAAQAIGMTILYPATTWLFLLIFYIFEDEHGYVLSVTAVILFVLSVLWMRMSRSAGALGCAFLFFSVTVHCGSLFWTIGTDGDYPVAAMNPVYWVLTMLDGYHRADGHDFTAMFCYWGGLLFTVFVARSFLIWRFDDLAGRVRGRRRAVRG